MRPPSERDKPILPAIADRKPRDRARRLPKKRLASEANLQVYSNLLPLGVPVVVPVVVPLGRVKW